MKFSRFLILVIATLSSPWLCAGNVTWSAATDGNWNLPSNWSDNATPSIDDTAFITNSAAVSIVSGDDAQANLLHIRGESELNLSGTGKLSVLKEVFINGGRLNLSGDSSLSMGSSTVQSNLYLGHEKGTHGEANVGGDAVLSISWGIQMGWGGTASLSLTDNAKVYAMRNLEIGMSNSSTVEINDNAYLYTMNNLFLGRYSTGEGKLIINGGKMYLDQDGGAGYGVLVVGGEGKGEFTINGGELSMKEYIRLSNSSSADGVVNLNGGLVQTRGIHQYAGGDGNWGSGQINFNGGTIDTNGQDLRVNSTVSGVGTLTKTGAGLLAFSQSNTMTGDINVLQGGIVAANENALGTGTVLLNTGTTLDSSVTGANMGALSVSGGSVSFNGTDVGQYNLSGDLVVDGGTFYINIASTANFDKFVGDASNVFSLSNLLIDLSGSTIDYSSTYWILEGFLSGDVDQGTLSIIGYDTTNWLAHLDNNGVLSFTQKIPEPAAAGLLGLLALAAVMRRKKRWVVL